MQGQRVADETVPCDLARGDYCLRGGILWGRTPNGMLCRIDERWTITENPDGSLTVDPSIKIHGGGGVLPWHGYLVAGVWSAV